MSQKKSVKKKKMERREYPQELKREAVKMLRDGHSATSIKERLGLSNTNLIYAWVKILEPAQGTKDDQAKLRQLQEELARTQRERDILKKALAIFSRTT